MHEDDLKCEDTSNQVIFDTKMILMEVGRQSCTLLRHLGTSCALGLETSIRILKEYWQAQSLYAIAVAIELR